MKIYRTSETTRESLKSNLNLKKYNEKYNGEEYQYWLVGFYETDSLNNISLNNRGELHFELNQHNEDIGLLYRIKSHLQCGTVTKGSDKATHKAKYNVYSKKQFEEIIYPVFNNKIQSEYKFNQFKAVCEKLGLPATRGNHNHLAWLTGIIDGDGSFKIKVSQRQISAELAIVQKRPEILEIIKEKYFDNKGNVNGGEDIVILRYQCTSTAWIEKKIKYPLLTRKNLAYNRWKDILELIEKKEHLKPERFEEIEEKSKKVNKFENHFENHTENHTENHSKKGEKELEEKLEEKKI